jgi:hypothetical protein
MDNASGRFCYVEDPDELDRISRNTKVPILKKIGWF